MLRGRNPQLADDGHETCGTRAGVRDEMNGTPYGDRLPADLADGTGDRACESLAGLLEASCWWIEAESLIAAWTRVRAPQPTSKYHQPNCVLRPSLIAPRQRRRCRCSACRSRSRTTSTSPACPPPPPARPSPTTPAQHAAVVQQLLDAGAVLRRQDQPRPVRLRPQRHALALWRRAATRFDARYVSAAAPAPARPTWSQRGEVDFALGTDTAGSGRVPAGLNNIVGLKPSRGLLSDARRGAGGAALDCVSIFARTVDDAAQVLQAIGATTPRTRTRALAARPPPLPARLRVRRAVRCSSSSATPGRGGLRRRRRRSSRRSAARRVTIDYAPLARGRRAALRQRRWWPSATPRSASSSTRTPTRSIRAVRSIIARRARYSAADLFAAQYAPARAAASAPPRCGTTSTCCWCPPRRPLHDREVEADPVALNRNLGTYTNFVNLLDYAALAVPAPARPTACRSASR